MSANGYLAVIPRLLVWSAQRLESVSFIPWPLWVGGLFPLYLGVIYFMVWFRRGSVWPVNCNYPITERGGPCKKHVPGEWYKCRWHNKEITYKFKRHTVDPKLCRWQEFDRNGRKVDLLVRGVGFFRRELPGQGILFCNGFTRPIGNVFGSFGGQVSKAWSRLRAMRLRTPTVEETVALEKRLGVEGIDVAEGMVSVALATRFTLYSFGLALVATGVAALLPATPKAMMQWAAILGFVLAWAAIRNGVYQRKQDWLGGTCLAALKWWAWAFVPVAAVGLVIGP